MPIGVKLDVIENSSNFRRKILQEFANVFNKTTNAILPTITEAAQFKITEIMESSSLYNDIIFTSLRGHMGIPVGEEKQRIDEIVDTIIRSVHAKSNPLKLIGNDYSEGSIQIVGIDNPLTFDRILSLPASIIVDEHGRETFPWMEKILKLGNTVIEDYRISFGNFSHPKAKSRSKIALMFKKQGTFWKVPSRYAGSYNENWITRTIKNNKDSFTLFMERTMQKAFERSV